MRDVLGDFGLSIFDHGPVAAVNFLRVRKLSRKPRQRALVRAHRSPGRCDYDGAFAENDVAGEKRALVAFVEEDVVEGVPRRIDRPEREPRTDKSPSNGRSRSCAASESGCAYTGAPVRLASSAAPGA